MAKNQDITIEGSLPVVLSNGLNTNKAVDFSGAPSVNLPVNTVIAGVGNLVDTSSVQTLTNKTLANPTTITGAVISGSTIGTSTVNGVTLSSTGSSSLFLTQAGTYVSASAGNLTGVVTSVGTVTSFGTFTSASLAAALSDETGSGSAVFATSPTLVTPALGTPTALVLTNATGLPAASVVAGTLGTGAYVMDTKLTVPQIINANNAITATSNAATVPITSRLSTVTNNSAATLTITLTTASATNGQLLMVRILDFSAVAETITWVNTENSTVSVPTTSNGSTTLPLTVGFQFNGATSLWRCLAVS